ncbi:hypothetical protein Aperf_G00000125523 [Anoplocephala perfoliata]
MEAANPALVKKPPVPLCHCNDENSPGQSRVQMLKNEPLLPRFVQNDLVSPAIPPGTRTGGLKSRKEEYEQPRVFKSSKTSSRHYRMLMWKTLLRDIFHHYTKISVSWALPVGGLIWFHAVLLRQCFPYRPYPLLPFLAEFKVDDNGMANDSVTQSPDQPNFRLAAVFNQFVHSPDEGGRLRGDVTKFTDAFLTNRSENPTGAGDRRGPPMFQNRLTMALINANFSLLLWVNELILNG